ncbi:MAG: hypothetical protein IT210_26715 [Armatimonadetes bacterium]|nr:hypothetical protein [Armatimonadota bacterium]
MPRRKPLIEPGSFLPESAAGEEEGDILSRIIERDRQQSGRGRPKKAPPPAEEAAPEPNAPETEAGESYDNMTSTQVILSYDRQTDNMTGKPYDNMTGKQAAPATNAPDSGEGEDAAASAGPQEAASAPPKREPARKSRPPAAKQDAPVLTQRIEDAAQRASTPSVTVTFRLPQAVNEWLDEYVHRAWPERVKKQDLVLEALKMLIARRGEAGAAVLPTELLGEEPEEGA